MKHKYPRSDFTGVNYLDLCSVLFFKHKNDVMRSSTQLAPSCGDIQNNLISPSGVCVCFVWIFKKCIIFGCNHECLNFLKRRLFCFPRDEILLDWLILSGWPTTVRLSITSGFVEGSLLIEHVGYKPVAAAPARFVKSLWCCFLFLTSVGLNWAVPSLRATAAVWAAAHWKSFCRQMFAS